MGGADIVVQREVLFKWSAYALCAALLQFLRTLVLGNLTLWGALPFLPPILLTCIASQEEMRSATIFGTVFGIVCDLTLSAPFPCLYTISFTLSALLIALLSEKVFQNYFLRTLSGTIVSFLITDLLCMLAFALSGDAAFSPMLSLAVRETVVSLPFFAVYPLFFLIRRFFTY